MDIIEKPVAIAFDSIINVRPSQGNRSRGVNDPALRARVAGIVKGLITG